MWGGATHVSVPKSSTDWTTALKNNLLLYSEVTILKYNKSTIDCAIYIKVFSDVTVSYLAFYTGGVLKTTNNNTSFPELRKKTEEYFEIKFQEEYVFK